MKKPKDRRLVTRTSVIREGKTMWIEITRNKRGHFFERCMRQDGSEVYHRRVRKAT